MLFFKCPKKKKGIQISSFPCPLNCSSPVLYIIGYSVIPYLILISRKKYTMSNYAS